MCYCNTRVLGYIRAFVADVKNAFLMLQDVFGMLCDVPLKIGDYFGVIF
jgi:hypothetical protein